MAHKTISSEAGDTASRKSAILRAIDELAGPDAWSWVTFESGGSSHVIEIAIDQQRFTLNIPHQEREGLVPKMRNLGLAIPPSWTLKKDKKKGLLSSGFLEIEVDAREKESLVAFVDRVGRELLAWEDVQRLSACLQN